MMIDSPTNVDVLIVGTGAAGLFCAMHLPQHLRVLMLSKDGFENSSSYLAQGGIAVLRGPDDIDDYIEDTRRAGHYENDPAAVLQVVINSPNVVSRLLDIGVIFDRTSTDFSFAKEGGHNKPRILHHEDFTGREITEKLLAHVKKLRHVKLLDHVRMLDIAVNNRRCCGVIAQDKNGQACFLGARVTVLATGGISGLFRHSTSYSHLTGDSIAAALRHGVTTRDLHYIQIHPTALYERKKERSFLISETVRGEGAHLLDASGQRFTDELLPRDRLCEAIREKMRHDGVDYVHLSMRHLPHKQVRERFPNICHHLKQKGYDLARDLIPVTLAQHYYMGGIMTDLSGQTSMDGLYAIGETACSGTHGKNRLGSNSLIESLVFAQKAAERIALADLPNDALSFVFDEEEYSNRDFDSESKALIFDQIKKEDPDFYEKWCV